MKAQSHVNARQNGRIEEELPHLDELDECLSLRISGRVLKGNLEDFSDSAFENAEIVALHVLHDAV